MSADYWTCRRCGKNYDIGIRVCPTCGPFELAKPPDVLTKPVAGHVNIEHRKPLIYVAGPFRASDRWCLERNIREAETVSFVIIQCGAVAACPHSMYRNFDGTLTDQHWIDATLELLKRCEAIAVTGRWRESAGARGEVMLADDMGLPRFEIIPPHAGALTEWIGEWQAQHPRLA